VTSHTDDLLQPGPEIAIQPKEICDMWPFTRKPIVDDETAAWHVENFTWLIEEFGPAALAHTKLVLPTAKYFRTAGEKGHELAIMIFDQVGAYCGMLAAPDSFTAARSFARRQCAP
jgi:hypothetical protein